MAPPGNQAANRENKPQPIVSEETGLLDSIMEAAFVVELAFLNGREKLKGLDVFSIVRY